MSESEGTRKVKFSITLPPEQATAIDEAVRAGQAPSASAYISARLSEDAVRAAAREETKRWIEALNGGPVGQEYRDYWLRRFGVIGEEPGRASA